MAVELKKGECTFHHRLMVHGSFENRTERPRRATVINAFLDGPSDSDEALLAGVPPIPKGRPWAVSSSRCCSTPAACRSTKTLVCRVAAADRCRGF